MEAILLASEVAVRIAVLEQHSRYRDQLAYALDRQPVEIVGHEQISSFGPEDKAILIGLEDDWLSGRHVEALQAAGERGAERLLWQLEPLPPPGMPSVSRWIVSADLSLQARRPRSRKRASPKGWTVADRLVMGSLAASLRARRAEEPSQVRTPKMLRYPMRQSRSIVSLWRSRMLDRVLVSLPSRRAFLSEVGVPSEVVPAGYGPWYGGPLPGVSRDLDVVFLGKVNPRRSPLLSRFETELARRGRELRIVDRNCYDNARTELLNRTKILLNLHKFPWEFPLMRLMMAMSCGALVVSEPAESPLTFFDERHLVIEPLDRLLDAIILHLEDEDRRRRIAAAAFERVTTELTLESVMVPALLKRQPALQT